MKAGHQNQNQKMKVPLHRVWWNSWCGPCNVIYFFSRCMAWYCPFLPGERRRKASHRARETEYGWHGRHTEAGGGNRGRGRKEEKREKSGNSREGVGLCLVVGIRDSRKKREREKNVTNASSGPQNEGQNSRHHPIFPRRHHDHGRQTLQL